MNGKKIVTGMDGEAGPSKPKRIKKNYYNLEDSDIEEQLFGDHSSDEDFNIEDEAGLLGWSDEDDDEEELNFKVAAINMATSPTADQPAQLNKPSTEASTSKWTTTGQLKNIAFTKQNQFFGDVGSTPLDYFNFFFDEQLLEMICRETNAQAERLFLQGMLEHSRITSWRNVAIPELKIFLGLLFHMGTIQLSRIQDYWKTHRLFSINIFGEQMSRNRFMLIMRCLHFTSNTENEDPLNKIRSVIDYFNNKMNQCYYPAKELSLDESMVLWRGRLKFKQFIKNKRHKFGIKLYMLTEPDGLILKFRVYAGGQDTDVTGKGHAEKVVMKLLEEKLQSGHSVYMDNYYNSFTLAKRLLDNNTYCTGTLRKDLKENPREVVQKTLKKGENVSLFREGIHIGKWKDKRPVMYISTEYEDRTVPVANKRGQVADKPEAIAKYNQFMSGVDRQDQLLAFYPCERKTLRWYLKLAIHTFQLLFINSYKMYNKYSGNPKMSLYDYRLAIIDKLLPEKRAPVVVTPRARREVPHTIGKITEKNAKGIRKRKMCRMCSKTGMGRKDTIWHCEMCKDKPGLCVECFDLYHSSL